jgi:DNA-binding MarR family transcriptional regulator
MVLRGDRGEAVTVTETERRLTRRQRLRLVAWARLARVYHDLDRASAELLRDYNLSVAQFDVLVHVGQREGLMQQELADRLLVTKGNVSQIIARMVRDGLVRRAQDGRTRRLFLTDAGRVLYAQAVPAQEAMIATRFGVLTDDALLPLARSLRHLQRGDEPGIE